MSHLKVCWRCELPFRSKRSDALTCSGPCRRARSRFYRGPRSKIYAREYGLSRGDLWGTPPPLFAVLDAEFGFVLDAAALPDDTLCPVFIGPDENALTVSWSARCPRPGAVFCNPPYSLRGGHLAWILKALAEARAGLVVVLLVGAGSGSRAMQTARREATEIRHGRRRLACIHPDTRKPSGSNNVDQKLIVCTPAGGPARITDYDPPLEACTAANRQRADWPQQKQGAGFL